MISMRKNRDTDVKRRPYSAADAILQNGGYHAIVHMNNRHIKIRASHASPDLKLTLTLSKRGLIHVKVATGNETQKRAIVYGTTEDYRRLISDVAQAHSKVATSEPEIEKRAREVGDEIRTVINKVMGVAQERMDGNASLFHASADDYFASGTSYTRFLERTASFVAKLKVHRENLEFANAMPNPRSANDYKSVQALFVAQRRA